MLGGSRVTRIPYIPGENYTTRHLATFDLETLLLGETTRFNLKMVREDALNVPGQLATVWTPTFRPNEAFGYRVVVVLKQTLILESVQENIPIDEC